MHDCTQVVVPVGRRQAGGAQHGVLDGVAQGARRAGCAAFGHAQPRRRCTMRPGLCVMAGLAAAPLPCGSKNGTVALLPVVLA